MRFSEGICRHFFTRQFLLFLVVGVINTFNGTFLSWLFTFVTGDANIAFNIGYILSNVIAYLLNSRFIFHARLSVRRFVKFALSYIPNFIIQNVIVLIFYNALGFPPVVSYIVAAVLGVPVTFLFVKLFAFGAVKE